MIAKSQASGYWPQITSFPKYDPLPTAGTLGARIEAKRWELGLSQRGLSKLLGIDAGTASRWEKGEWEPTPPKRWVLDRIFKNPISNTWARERSTPAPETVIAAVSPAPWMGASTAAIATVLADHQVLN
jgi:DNA-binding transcriptional regulator YiaG